VGSAEVADYLRELSEKDLKPAQRVLEAVEIVACASAGKFDLIVVGSKGRGAIADLLLGSVAQRVLAMAQQPVLLVK